VSSAGVASRTPAPEASWRQWAGRFSQGFLRPFALVRRLRQEPVAWGAYLRTVVVQAALTVGIGSAYFVYHLPEARQDAESVVEARSELKAAHQTQVEARRALERARKALEVRSAPPAVPVPPAPPGPGAVPEPPAAPAPPLGETTAAPPVRPERHRPRLEAAQSRAEARTERKRAERARARAQQPPPPPADEGEALVPPEEVRLKVGGAQYSLPARAALEKVRAALEEAQASPEGQALQAEVRAALDEAKATPEARAALEQAGAALAKAAPRARAVEAQVLQTLEKAGGSVDTRAALERAREALPAEAQEALDAALERAQGTLEAARERADLAADRVKDAQEAEQDAAEKLRDAEAEASLDWWKTLGLWVSSLVLAQYLVLGLSRDFQDRIARDLSLVAGLQPEDVPPWTRIRVDFTWLMRKARRKVRGALAVAAGVTLLSPLILVGTILGFKQQASSAVVGLVSAYWWVVFSAARSARAWRFEADLTPPRPIRVLLAGAETVPFLRWALPRLVLRFCRWATVALWAPARAVEADFATFAGLGLARVVATLPVVRIALRGALVVAAGETLEASVPVDLGPLVLDAPPVRLDASEGATARPRALQTTAP
jgi:hypothetical protein